MKNSKLILILFLACFILCCFYSKSYAETNITFRWDSVDVPDLAGFRLYEKYDPNSSYNPVAVIADPKATEYTLENVPDGKNLSWVLRAYDTDGLESGNSNSVNQNLTGPPPIPGSFRIKVIVDVSVTQ